MAQRERHLLMGGRQMEGTNLTLTSCPLTSTGTHMDPYTPSGTTERARGVKLGEHGEESGSHFLYPLPLCVLIQGLTL